MQLSLFIKSVLIIPEIKKSNIMQICLKFLDNDMIDKLNNSCLSLQGAPKSLLMLEDLKLLK